MKNCKAGFLFIIATLFLCSTRLHAQKTNPQNQKEMQERLKNAQAEYDKLSPEQKKMLEQMGAKVPGVANNPVLNSKNAVQVNKAMKAEFGAVPERDAARIATISVTPLSTASIAGYLANTHQKISAKLNAESKQTGDLIYAELTGMNSSAMEMGNTAVAIWMSGRLQLALYLMGRALKLQPDNTDNQSNYASMLSMAGEEPLSIPILNKLNAQFPKNSTLLNNLGQAWFSLGEIDKAGKFLDSAILIFPFHGQANYTCSFIQEQKGNKALAIEHVKKSLQHSVSQDKANRLRKLGYSLSYQDIPLPFKADPDPLGLSDFKLPAFPENAKEETGLRKQWEEFGKSLLSRLEELMKKLNALQQPMIEAAAKKGKANIEYYQKHQQLPPATDAELTPGFSRRASLKLKLLLSDKAFMGRNDKAKKEIEAFRKSKDIYRLEYEKAYEKLDRKHAMQMGEGLANSSMCEDFIKLADQYYKNVANTELEGLVTDYLKYTRLELNEKIFWQQFIMSPEEFAVTVLKYRIEYLGAMHMTYLGYNTPIVSVKDCIDEMNQKKMGKLANFNDLHCMVRGELDFPIGNMKIECGKLTSSIGLGPVKFSMVQDMDKSKGDGMFDDFAKCNVEVAAGKSWKAGVGPVEAKVGVEAGIGVEIGRNGIEDVYLTGEAGAGVGTNAISNLEKSTGQEMSKEGVGITDKSIKVGASGRMSLISGRTEFSGLQSNILK